MFGEILTGLGAVASGIGAIGNLWQSNQNYQLQRENLDYQKSLQQTIFNREDTALQRRMEDAKAAGLNPYSVINSGGANAGSVVKTEAPQMNFNMNGLMDAVNSYLSMQQNYQNTLAAKADAENKVKSGLILDADLIQKGWQNKILGVNYDDATLYNAMLTLDRERHEEEFNYDFNRNIHQQFWYPTGLYTNTEVEWPYNYNKGTRYTNMRNFEYTMAQQAADQSVYSTSALAALNRYNEKAYGYDLDMMGIRKSLMQKENDWYNFNQGFDKVTGAIDSISGILFKGLDLGLRKANAKNQWNLNASSAYKNYAQGYHYYYGNN